MRKHVHDNILYDDIWNWYPDHQTMSIIVTEPEPQRIPYLLVPDPRGGFRQHLIQPPQKRKLGF